MNTAIQNRPFFNSQLYLAGSTTPRAFSDAVADLDEPGILPDSHADNSFQDSLSQAPRRMRPLRFATGLVLTTIGMVIILLIVVRMLEVQPLAGSFSLPLVAIGVMSGVTMLGGGFGLMAAASSGFDEQEFDRLMRAGNIASAEMEREPTEGP